MSFITTAFGEGQTLLVVKVKQSKNCTIMTEVYVNNADGKPKSKASPTSNLLLSDALPLFINISPPFGRKEAGHYWLDEDKGDALKAKRHKGSMFAEPNVS